MEWYIGCWKKYSDFTGRARRTEYWMFVLLNVVVMIGVGIVDTMLGLLGSLVALYSLAAFLPNLAVSARRLHDTDRSAWWILLMFLPVLGPIILIIFFVQNGQSGANRFGSDPKLASE